MAAVPFEIKLDEKYQDINSDEGFVHALLLALSCGPGSVALAAIVCSTWVYMNRGTSGRFTWRPLGRGYYPSVAAANKMVSRMVLLIMILIAVGAVVLIEQPKGSIMECHPRMSWLFSHKHLKFWKKAFPMKLFGGNTEKPTWLYCDKKEVDDITDFSLPRKLRTRNVEMVKRYKDRHGVIRVQGGKDLKQSQSYPRGFGKAVAKWHLKHADKFKRDAMKLHQEVAMT